MKCRHIRKNPDEELRRLERLALSGDELALDRLHHQRTRSGLPAHSHWCDACIFLGSQPIVGKVKLAEDEYLGCAYPFYDFYYCPGKQNLGGSLLARFGCVDSLYSSWPLDVYLSAPELQRGIRQQIYELARARNLIPSGRTSRPWGWPVEGRAHP